MNRSFAFLCCLWAITTSYSVLLGQPPKHDLCSWGWDNTPDQRKQGQTDIKNLFPEASTEGGLFLSMREAETEQPGETYRVPNTDIQYCRHNDTVFFRANVQNLLTDGQGRYYEPNDFGTVLIIDETSEPKETWHPLCAIYLPDFTRGWLRWPEQAQDENQRMLLSPKTLEDDQVEAIWKQPWQEMSTFPNTVQEKDDTSSVPTDTHAPAKQEKGHKRTQSSSYGKRKRRRGHKISSPSSAPSAPSMPHEDEARGEHGRPVPQTQDTSTENGDKAAEDSQKKENRPQEDTHKNATFSPSQPLLWAVTHAPPLDYRGVQSQDYVRPKNFFPSSAPLLQALTIMEKNSDLLPRIGQLKTSTTKATQDDIRTPKTLKKKATQDYASGLGCP